MATYYRTKGFVYDKRDKGEADRIFAVFSSDFGKLEVKAKAIRKINSKLRSGIDLFYLSELEFIEGKNGKTLTDACAIDRFGIITEDLQKASIAFKISKVLGSFLKGHGKDDAVYKLLGETFNRLNNKLEFRNSELIYYCFLWNFLSSQGYRPEVHKCIICQLKLNPYSIYFSFKDGGLMCRNCYQTGRNANKINSDIAKVLRIILEKDWEVLSKLKIEQVSLEILKTISEKAGVVFSPENV